MWSVVFKIEKCSPDKNPPGFCKSEKEINEYIQDLQVQLIILEQSHDIRKFH